MFLAHVAWNKDTKSRSYLSGKDLILQMEEFPINRKTIKQELISDNWETIISKMLAYKKKHFRNDRRIITLLAYMPWQTLRVEWK
jgi:hypothetical protein